MTRRPVQKVAVIGAGISGVVSAAHLLAAGIEVTVFERNDAAGGVWLHDERKPLDPVYPSTKPSQAERHDDPLPEGNDKRRLEHAPPGPCYDGLRNNVSTPLMRTKLCAWPDGTPDFVSHVVMKQYIQDTSANAGVEKATVYGARVTSLRKKDDRWDLTWSTLIEGLHSGLVEEKDHISTFDAVVVASGHYHAPRIPDIPGLSDAKARWPARIFHSKGYRKPDGFENRNILLIGGGVSATDIAREIGSTAKTVYQSTRNGEFDLPSSMLPENSLRISEIDRIEVQSGIQILDNAPLPLVVHLKSGQRLCGIDGIIICTGYHITLPFLREYHDDETSAADANNTVLVTDGTQVHNLHKDIFYIPDPTLVFVGVSYYTATFTLFEFQAIVVAAVFSGAAQLPSKEKMRAEYTGRIKAKGSGRAFHSLKDVEEHYVDDILNWVNRGRAAHGLPAIEGHTKTWHAAKEAQRERLKQLFATGNRRDSGVGEIPVLDVCS
ncbi:putative FAD dependent oxidoreductase [Aspergillus clavatus NRRL 1]|uniref:Dimethylaniline monooxygenase n=1 Tax=Aspergillus clavatus (strain ATCC 1007 / CBS 513.65 / DSM 816 / NCTC 3887 / NRRL 1 / QM 1276 / 107) TaxID=344612 RepID=A1CCY1_ASPCL|nr:dimethylaniline monooxygenase [Aspergillus clavatus NRRL 1]EAW12388.1 dimethylaniline monooxygenase [Aspergillus clavatus NRRL 1]